MIRIVLAGIAVAILTFIINLLNHVGAFKDVSISLSTEPAMKLIYKEHVGAYHKIVPVIQEVEKWAKEKGIDCSKSFGEYLDNPDKIEEERRKSNGGCVVSAYPTEMPMGFEKKEISEKKYIKAIFEGSPSIGPYKVYPKVIKFAKENRLKLLDPVIEIYNIKSEKEMITTYLFFLE